MIQITTKFGDAGVGESVKTDGMPPEQEAYVAESMAKSLAAILANRGPKVVAVSVRLHVEVTTVVAPAPVEGMEVKLA